MVSSSLLYGRLNTKNFGETLNKREFDEKIKSNLAFFTLIESFCIYVAGILIHLYIFAQYRG